MSEHDEGWEYSEEDDRTDGSDAVRGVPCLTGMRIAGLVSSGPACSYVRQRGTEQECARWLWCVRAHDHEMVRDIVPAGYAFVSCTLHLPRLLTDRLVREYSLSRVRT